MAPFFGASTIIWANTIGVVLVALSIGYWLGGRLADRRPDVRSLCLVVLVAARPAGDRAAGRAAVLRPLRRRARRDRGRGVRRLARRRPAPGRDPDRPARHLLAVGAATGGRPTSSTPGRIAGRLYALSTVGSLTGTMVVGAGADPARRDSAHLPGLRPRAGAGRGGRARLALRRRPGGGWPAAIALPVGTLKASDDGTVLYEDESEHQYIRVIEEADGDRVLELNEGQAVHSILPARGYLTADYWDSFLVLPFAARAEPPRRIAILGNAAGTIARSYGRFWPATEVDGVEIDPELSEVGYRYFDMGSNPNLTVYDEDARPWLRRSDGGYDLIVVDAYRQPYIPFYLVDQGVLRARRRPARARRGGGRQRRPPRGQRRLRAGARRDDGRGASRPCCATPPSRPTRCCSAARRRRLAERLARRRGAHARQPAQAGADRRARGSGRGCRAAASTPTTTPRSSGWSTARSSATRRDRVRRS